MGETLDSSGNTTTTVFTINSGEIQTTYTVSLTSNVTNSSNGTRTWNYGVQINPALSAGENISFDLGLNHVRQYRNTGISSFSYVHTITKNGNLNIPYTTSSTNTTSVDTGCTVKPTQQITETFTNFANSLNLSSTDTSLNGVVTQTVTINGNGLDCSTECRMVGTYNTTLQVSNLRLNNSNCGTVVNANTPIAENITIYDCTAPLP
jgi:hypothetical protein